MKITLLSIVLCVFALTSCNHDDHHTHDDDTTKTETKMTKPVLLHTVFFWLNDDTTAEQKTAFEAGLVKLGTCPQILNFYWGTPASTEARDVVDNSYAYAINVQFASDAQQLEYQSEPIHLAFIEDHKAIWKKVIVYDNTVK